MDVCPKCGYHMRIGARRRHWQAQKLNIFLDESGHQEIGQEIEPIDRLKFKDVKKYKERLSEAQKNTGERDALITVVGTLKSMPVIVCAFEFSFNGGSMGYAVGEKFSLAAKYALEHRKPLICFSASGGARMQRLLSL